MVQIGQKQAPNGNEAAYALVGAVERALDLARRDTRATVLLFKADWAEVDLARRRIAAAGMGDRVAARHIDALRLAGRATRALRWTN